MSQVTQGLTRLRATLAQPEAPSVADAVARALAQLGVTHAFGVVGGGIAPVGDALNRSEIRVIHTRHEAGAAFAATEASLFAERPAAVFTTTGPGLTNSLTGLFVARREGAKVICVSGVTPANMRERWVLQESGPHSLLSGLYTPGPLFDYATVLEHPDQLEVAVRRLAAGLRRPQGFVAHVGIPANLQTARMPRGLRALDEEELRLDRRVDSQDVERCARLLSSSRAMLWVGYGARGCTAQIVELAERLGAPVMATPRAKGVMPETHPLYVGVTGFGGHPGPAKAVRELRPEHIVVLGSRLGEFSSGWAKALEPETGFVQIDVDADVLGVAYPEVPTFGVCAELSVFLPALLERLPSRPRASQVELRAPLPGPAPSPRRQGRVRPPVLMDALQRIVVEGSDAPVYADAGNSFAWTTHLLRFPGPNRFRANMGWGSMGHGTTGVLGAALAGPAKVVAVVGDGAMLMNCEVSTAVQYRLPIVWVVLNDSLYGMIEHGMRVGGFVPVETAIPATDFVALARAMGAEGLRVESELELDAGLREAMRASGPFVVDVVVDPTIAAPVESRLNCLRDQGAHLE